jgi:hypothetical protein
MNVTGSVQTLMDQLDIENTSNSPIYITKGWPYISLTSSFLNAPCGYSAITSAVGLSGFIISGNLLENQCSSLNAAVAISLPLSNYGFIGSNSINSYFTPVNNYSTTGVDLSYAFTNGGSTLNLGCAVTNCNTTGGVVFNGFYSGAAFTGGISFSYTGDGIDFTAIRDLTGKGFYFKSAGGSTRLFIDSGTGAVTTGNNTLDDGSGNATIKGTGAFGGGTFTVGTSSTGGGGTSTLTLQGNYGGAYSATIKADYAGAGLVFTLPRNLSGKGYAFQNSGGTTTLGYLDSSTGSFELAVAGAALILKSPNSTCYPVTVGNGGGSLTVGSSVTCPY